MDKLRAVAHERDLAIALARSSREEADALRALIRARMGEDVNLPGRDQRAGLRLVDGVANAHLVLVVADWVASWAVASGWGVRLPLELPLHF